jgi:hypothetical protein
MSRTGRREPKEACGWVGGWVRLLLAEVLEMHQMSMTLL